MSRVALVTGGSRGIGAAISKTLKDAGYTVAATYAGNDEKAAAFTERTGIQARKWDVGDHEACLAGCASVAEEFGDVGIVGADPGTKQLQPAARAGGLNNRGLKVGGAAELLGHSRGKRKHRGGAHDADLVPRRGDAGGGRRARRRRRRQLPALALFMARLRQSRRMRAPNPAWKVKSWSARPMMIPNSSGWNQAATSILR